MPRPVGAALHFADQRAPFGARAPVIIPVGSRVFAAMIEELYIFPLERLDLSLDEGVQLGKLVCDFLRQFEIHGASPWCSISLKTVSREQSARMGGCC